MSRDTDLAWAAGIIDGEGCISIRAHRKDGVVRSYSLLLKVTMGHRESIDRLWSIFQTGSIQNVDQRRWNPAWSLVCTTLQAKTVLDLVYPYLVTKRVEADLAQQFFDVHVISGRRMTPYVRERKIELFIAMRDAKPSARFRVGLGAT